MQRCEWCGQEYRGLSPIKNRDPSLPGRFVWVCDGCREAVQGEYWCGAFCAPIGFQLASKRPATSEVQHLSEWRECAISEPEVPRQVLSERRNSQKKRPRRFKQREFRDLEDEAVVDAFNDSEKLFHIDADTSITNYRNHNGLVRGMHFWFGPKRTRFYDLG